MPKNAVDPVIATSPAGRTREMGQPLKMAELIAQLDGPVYVERVALYDNKQRTRAQRAILKAIRMQAEGRGFAFVEVLSECPTHLKATPEEAEQWVKEKMTPIFPLGVKKDLETEPWFAMKKPNHSVQKLMEVIGANKKKTPTFCQAFPEQIDSQDIALKLAGAGGDGAQTAAMLITRAAINEGFDATHIPSYGPESRGGTSFADVHIASEEVLSPASPTPHILVAFNAPSLMKFGPTVQPGGTILYDSTVISEVPNVQDDVQLYGIPFTQIAADLGKVLVKNIVALGALQAATDLMPKESLLTAIQQALANKCAMIPLNEAAFESGAEALCLEMDRRN